MRYIEKKALAKELQQKLMNALNNNVSWDNFTGGKAELREHLDTEQAGLCAYSEISLSEFGFHIEHIKPKGLPNYAALRFDSQNLLASAPDNQKNVDHSNLFGGHKKGNNYDEKLFISPTEEDCERYFQYSPKGNIEPKNGLLSSEADRAEHTIDCLGLQDSRLLRKKRRDLYQAFNNQLGFLMDQPKPEALLLFYKDDYLTPDNVGNLKPFQSLVKQIFNCRI